MPQPWRGVGGSISRLWCAPIVRTPMLQAAGPEGWIRPSSGPHAPRRQLAELVPAGFRHETYHLEDGLSLGTTARTSSVSPGRTR